LGLGIGGYLFASKYRGVFEIRNKAIKFYYRKDSKQINLSEITSFQFTETIHPPGFREIEFGAYTVNNSYITIYREDMTYFIGRWLRFLDRLSNYAGLEVKRRRFIEDMEGKLQEDQK